MRTALAVLLSLALCASCSSRRGADDDDDEVADGDADADADMDADADADADGDADTDADADADADADGDADGDCAPLEPTCGPLDPHACPDGHDACVDLATELFTCLPTASCPLCCGGSCLDGSTSCATGCDRLEGCGGCQVDRITCQGDQGLQWEECPEGFLLCELAGQGACVNAANCEACCTVGCEETTHECG